MRGLYGALVVAVAALLVSCSAKPYWGEQGPLRYDQHGLRNRVLNPSYETNFVDVGPRSPYGVHMQNVLDYVSRPKYQTKYLPSPLENSLYYGGMEIDNVKPNLHDIDWSNLEAYIAQKNLLNEINHSSLPFPYANMRSNLGFRRRIPVYGSPQFFMRSDDNTTEKPKSDDGPGNFDEIDQTNIPIGGG